MLCIIYPYPSDDDSGKMIFLFDIQYKEPANQNFNHFYPPIKYRNFILNLKETSSFY